MGKRQIRLKVARQG